MSSEHVKTTPHKLKVSDDIPSEPGSSELSVRTESGEQAGPSGESAPEAAPQSQFDHPIKTLKPDFTQGASKSMSRHRMIAASCAIVSLFILSISLINLNPLISTPATIDRNMRITQVVLPPLPNNLIFATEYGRSNQNPTAQENGLYEVRESTWHGTLTGFVDKNGNVVIKPQFGLVDEFSEGLAAARPNWKAQERGYIDQTGKLVIPAKYTEANAFKNGFAFVMHDSKLSLIDRTGKEVDVKNLRSLHGRHGDIYIAQADDTNFGIIDSKGNWLLKPEYDSVAAFERNSGFISGDSDKAPDASVFKIVKNGLVGIADKTGKILVPPKYSRIDDFGNGCATISQNDKLGFANANGIVVEPTYDDLTQFGDLIAAKNDKLWHLMDRSGKLLDVPTVDGVISDPETGKWLNDGLGAIIKNDKVGYVNTSGKIAIPPQFDFGYSFREGFAPVYLNSYWRFINTAGSIVSPPLALASPFFNGQATVEQPGPIYEFTNGSAIEQASTRAKAERKQRLPGEENTDNDRPEY